MLELLIEYITGHEGVSFDACGNIARDFRKRYPFETHSRFPFEQDYP